MHTRSWCTVSKRARLELCMIVKLQWPGFSRTMTKISKEGCRLCFCFCFIAPQLRRHWRILQIQNVAVSVRLPCLQNSSRIGTANGTRKTVRHQFQRELGKGRTQNRLNFARAGWRLVPWRSGSLCSVSFIIPQEHFLASCFGYLQQRRWFSGQCQISFWRWKQTQATRAVICQVVVVVNDNKPFFLCILFWFYSFINTILLLLLLTLCQVPEAFQRHRCRRRWMRFQNQTPQLQRSWWRRPEQLHPQVLLGLWVHFVLRRGFEHHVCRGNSCCFNQWCRNVQ